MNHSDGLLAALREYADAVRSTTRATAEGDPESQLVAPMRQLLEATGHSFARDLTIVHETSIRGLGQPDCCIEDHGVLIGYVELKAPGKGADPEQYLGHDRRQWDRFRQLPNPHGTEFGLYRSGCSRCLENPL
jgi:hypothetical protein